MSFFDDLGSFFDSAGDIATSPGDTFAPGDMSQLEWQQFLQDLVDTPTAPDSGTSPWSTLLRTLLGALPLGTGVAGVLQRLLSRARPSTSTTSRTAGFTPEQQALFAQALGALPGVQSSIAARQPLSDTAFGAGVGGMLQQPGVYSRLIRSLMRPQAGMRALGSRLPMTEMAFRGGLGSMMDIARRAFDPSRIPALLGQQGDILNTLLPSAKALATGNLPAISPQTIALINQSFAPDERAINEAASLNVESRGLGGAGMAGPMAAADLSSVEGQKARALMDFAIRAPQAAAGMAGDYGGAAANTSNIYTQLAQQLLGAGSQGLGIYDAMRQLQGQRYNLLTQLLTGEQGALGSLAQQGQLGVANPLQLLQVLLGAIQPPANRFENTRGTSERAPMDLLGLVNPMMGLLRMGTSMFGDQGETGQQIPPELLMQILQFILSSQGR